MLLYKASSQLKASDLILNYLTLQTTNELWQECVVDASAKTVYKVNKHCYYINKYLNSHISVLFIHKVSLYKGLTTCVYCLVLLVCFLVYSFECILNVISSSCVQTRLGLYTNINCFDYGNVSFTEVALLTHQSLQDQASFL